MKIGVFYGSTSGTTARLARAIAAQLGPDVVTTVADIQSADLEALAAHDVVVLGAPTYALGEMQHDWADVWAELERLDLSGTRIAVFGAGDQREFPETFQDAMGLLYQKLIDLGARGGYGAWSAAGYRFKASRSVRNGRFCGLALDEHNQPGLTHARIRRWCRRLRRELDLPALTSLKRAG